MHTLQTCADLVQAVARAGRRVSDRRSGGAGGRTGGREAVNLLDRMGKFTLPGGHHSSGIP
jgi:hypothetical protein